MMNKLNNAFDTVINIVYTTYKILTNKLFYIPVIALSVSIAVYAFADNYSLRSPVLIKVQSAYVKREKSIIQMLSPIAQAKEEKVLTDNQILESYRLAPLLKSIYMLESTKGKQDGCKDQGKFNGFGFRQNSAEHKCFDSFSAVTAVVNEWFEDRLKTNGNNIAEAACYYNTGTPNQESCTYSQNLMRVLVDNF